MPNNQEQIQRRAYELWHQAGRPEGSDQHYWYAAERELSQSTPLKKMSAAPASGQPKAGADASEAKNSARTRGLNAARAGGRPVANPLI